jgi:hypothetical protein
MSLRTLIDETVLAIPVSDWIGRHGSLYLRTIYRGRPRRGMTLTLVGKVLWRFRQSPFKDTAWQSGFHFVDRDQCIQRNRPK